MEKEQLWQAALGELELLLSKANFTTWFKNTFISSCENGGAVIGVPNTFTKAWLENKYKGIILKVLKKITNEQIKGLDFKVESLKKSGPERIAKEKIKESVVAQEAAKSLVFNNKTINESLPLKENGFVLNPRYTFDNFIVGKGNELARAAAMAVAEKPGLVYNPLFIYGGVGLGKTHLLQAIGHQVKENFKDKKVIYVTCEKFTNEFVQAISKGRINRFKDIYRSADVLLIDDIQFLAGKEGTQEEFFHTFNTLHQANKQIVINSDRPPKAIPALENRLISRFEWGMIVDIAQPDLETRLAILETKCKEKGYSLKPEILSFLATNVQSNVRELEGALNKIIAFHQLNRVEPTLASTKDLIAGLVRQPKRGGLTSKQIIQTVANFFEITIDNLISDSRKKELVGPRQIVMYLMREELKSSYPNIGQEMGGRDHTTAMHACSKISREIERDEKIRQDINLIKQRLYN